MSADEPVARRRTLALLTWGLGLALAPLGLGGPTVLSPAAAWADGDHSGPGGDDDDDDDDDDDSSGPGRGGDDDDDNSGPGGGGDDGGGGRSGPGSGGSGSGRDRFGGGPSEDWPEDDGPGIRDITVYYPDGWVERIVAGRYELIDHQHRLVVARPATAQDFARMIALR